MKSKEKQEIIEKHEKLMWNKHYSNQEDFHKGMIDFANELTNLTSIKKDEEIKELKKSLKINQDYINLLHNLRKQNLKNILGEFDKLIKKAEKYELAKQERNEELKNCWNNAVWVELIDLKKILSKYQIPLNREKAKKESPLTVKMSVNSEESDPKEIPLENVSEGSSTQICKNCIYTEKEHGGSYNNKSCDKFEPKGEKQ